MNKKKIVFIINPKSGNGNKSDVLSIIKSELDAEKFECIIRFTEYSGHAAVIASEAVADGAYIVVAVGGDGTVNEVARSLVHTDTALAIIPMGSGNGLARHLTIPINAKRAVRLINKCEIHTLDYGKINDIPFFCTCGMGFDAVVSMQFAHAGRRGPTTYWEKVLNEVVKYKPETYEIEDEEGKKTYKAFLITCANASQWGNNAYIAPHASMSDGMMDVIIVEPFNAFDAPLLATQLFSKTIESHSRIKHFRSKKIHIHRAKSGVIHFDGDPVMTEADVTVEMISQGIKVVVNPRKHPNRNQQSDDDTTRSFSLQNPITLLNTPLYYLKEFFRIPTKPF